MSGDAAAPKGLAAAVAAVDRALEARPGLDGHALTEATQALCAYRDGLRRQVRDDEASPESRNRLAQANAIVSLLHAGHFPLGPIPWALLEQARDGLKSLQDKAA